jgi:hypothetical protein
MGAEIHVNTTCREANPPEATHAPGAVLFAVAEGDAAKQPGDAVLAHIFGCRTCSATVRELRSGLAAFAVAPRVKPAAADGVDHGVGLGDDGLHAPSRPPTPTAEALLAAGEGAATDSGSAGASRKLIVKLAVVGVLLAAILWWMRSFAAGLS